MPFKPEAVVLPDWIYDLAGDDQCLLDVLLEAGVVSAVAHRAVEERGDDGILDAIRDGCTPQTSAR